MEKQRRVFEIIRSRVGVYQLADTLADVLGISTDAVYRRMRCEKELTFSELCKLCERFDLSMDDMLLTNNEKGSSNVVLFYNMAKYFNPLLYIEHLRTLLNEMKRIRAAEKKEMIVTVHDFPFYHYSGFYDLLCFKLYMIYDLGGVGFMSYEDFCSRLDKNEIMGLLKEIRNAYNDIPSKEIWTNRIGDPLIAYISHHYKLAGARYKAMSLLMLNQVKEVVKQVETDVGAGRKDHGTKAPFELYVCPYPVGNTISVNVDGKKSSITSLTAINDEVFSYKNSFCTDLEHWVRSLLSRSKLISATNSECHYYFLSIYEKINEVIHQIENS
ncbi:MAG: hypothetical protein LBR50_05900 [Tannerella sp.]|jgi:hypothetical protein|nr:hypothetical protein [Tannerella sp.]